MPDSVGEKTTTFAPIYVFTFTKLSLAFLLLSLKKFVTFSRYNKRKLNEGDARNEKRKNNEKIQFNSNEKKRKKFEQKQKKKNQSDENFLIK